MSTFSELFKRNDIKNIFNTLNLIMKRTSATTPSVGSYLVWKTWKYRPEFSSKQEILFEESKQVKIILEIGVHFGHSLLIMLLANPTSKIYTIDINNYSIHAVNYLNSIFNNRVKYYNGDSLKLLPNVLIDIKQENKGIDLSHIDGAHEEYYIFNEINMIIPYCKDKLKIICDDYSTTTNGYDCPVNKAVDKAIKKHNLHIEKISNNDSSELSIISNWNNCVLSS